MSSFDLRSTVTLAVIGPLAVFGFAHVLIHLKHWFAHVLISLKRWFFPAPDLVWVGKVQQKSIPAFQDVAEFLERGDEDIELLRAATEKCMEGLLDIDEKDKVHRSFWPWKSSWEGRRGAVANSKKQVAIVEDIVFRMEDEVFKWIGSEVAGAKEPATAQPTALIGTPI